MSSICPSRICLIHAGAVGDFVLSLRLVGILRRTWPEARIEALAHQETASLGLGRAGIDAVTSLEMPGLHTFFTDAGSLDARCAAYFGRFDLIVNMYGQAGGVFDRRLAQATRGRIVTIDPRLRADWTGHVSDQWIDDLLAAGIGLDPSWRPLPQITFSPADRRCARGWLQQHAGTSDRRIVVMHPGAGSLRKCWPLKNFQDLARLVQARQVAVVFLLGPVEQDLWGDQLRGQLEQTAPVLPELDLTTAASLIAAADAYVGNDAGVSHVAAAVGTPTVALFGPTEPRTWRPLGAHVHVLRGTGQADQPFAGLDPPVVERALQGCLRSAAAAS